MYWPTGDTTFPRSKLEEVMTFLKGLNLGSDGVIPALGQGVMSSSCVLGDDGCFLGLILNLEAVVCLK